MLSETEAVLHRHLTDAEDERDRYRKALEEIAEMDELRPSLMVERAKEALADA